ncbi:prolyl oligopeptidase [Streptomyces sp. DvalAA-14]|uniref:prolyl oligopeptidase family serine peptidase n=1 Tax=unclassified Streptomyces TaxID=2593676 RepID=UPI00081B1F3C|nr:MULTISPECIES: prolyl oligopeptidase family serine peptidase [unclassified Streptomyces]MYS22163.1 prolyl oligopeptidase family serine peptidase [Streptomyces sp. SID4948]SCE09955.1 prolyl oligopeptidase [Streptomyces sp. DvalAA-14]
MSDASTLRREPFVESVQGRTVCDPYRWLEDDTDAECVQWLAAQDRMFAEHRPGWRARPAFRALLDELMDRGGAAVPVVSAPVVRGSRRFFLRRRAGQEMPVLVAAAEGEADEAGRVIVDPMELDPSGGTSLLAWRPSWSGRLLAFQVAAGGSESPRLRVLDVTRGRPVDGPLVLGRPTAVAWLADDTGFYYVTGSPAEPRRVRLHHLGDDPAHDPVVLETPMRHLSVSLSPDGRWLLVSAAAGPQTGNILRLADLQADATAGRGPGDPHLVTVHDGTAQGSSALVKAGPRGLLYAITDAGAPRGRVCVIDPAEPHSSAWTTVVEPGPDALLSACTALRDPGSGEVRLLVSTVRNGVPFLALHDVTGRRLTDIATPGTGPGTISGLSTPPGDSDRVWFRYTDFVTPPAVHRFALPQQRCEPETRHVSGIAAGGPRPPSRRPEQPVVRQLICRSEDGTPVGLYVISPAAPFDGPRPALLTAYGGFGASAAPAYSPSITAWVRAGGIYAVAGVRGGGEHGTTWHTAGRGAGKPNAFADFAAAARHLIDQGLTTPAQLAVKGASHSGLMVAVAITRNPELYAAAVCSDAITDMVRYPLFGLGAWWTKEFGTADDPDQLDTLLSYSPYHNVRPGTRYPAVLLTSPRVDPRVDAAHMRKLTAALQHATASGRPVLLRTEDGVGHGPRTASRYADLHSDALAFCAEHTGLVPPADGRPAG